MHISDWSSDVFSSDLRDGLVNDRVIGKRLFYLQHDLAGALLRCCGGQEGQGNDISLIFFRHESGGNGAPQACGHGQHDDDDDDGPSAMPHEKARTPRIPGGQRSEEHTSELQSPMRISYAVFCLKKKNTNTIPRHAIRVKISIQDI